MTEPWNARHAWREFAVTDVQTVAEFVDRYYKPDRIRDIRTELIASRKEDIANDGVCIISHYDSITGRTVAFYNPPL